MFTLGKMEGGALELRFAVQQPWKHQARRLRWGIQGDRLKALFACIVLDLGNGIGMAGLVLCFAFCAGELVAVV
jgi:hypothetical protein